MNNVSIIGNITADPKLSSTPSGHSVCEFSIAVTEKRKKGDEYVDETSFFDCVCWGRQGENLAKYHDKGDRIALSAKLKQERWDDKETGKTRSKVKLIVQSFTFAKGAPRSDAVPEEEEEYRGERVPF